MPKTLINTPNSPEEFGTVLSPAELRRLDFSALDYDALNRACIEYIRTYFPDEFNDFYANNGIIMLIELMSYIGNVLSQRSDILIDEAFLSTAQTKQSVIQHLQLINQEFRRATPAVVDIEISLPQPVPSEVRIPAGTSFNINGPDGKPVYYEIFRAPNDFTSSISIPPNKRGVIAYGVEGTTQTSTEATSNGELDQYIDLEEPNIIDEPITVTVYSGSKSVEWTRIPIIEKATSNDEVYEVLHLENVTRIRFGNNIAGKVPLAGQKIIIKYRTGGGIRGRIPSAAIDETRSVIPEPPYTAAIEARFRNVTPSQGGTDEETLEQAKRRAPREFATNENAVTGEDYSLLASNYSHPVYGSVTKAIGVIRTGIESDIDDVVQQIRNAGSDDAAVEILKNNYVNRNIVELYVLAESSDNTPIKPNAGLKAGLITYFDELNVLTDEVRVLDGEIKPVDIELIVIVSRNADSGTVKVSVNNAINEFFDIRNFDMGTELFVSNLYETLQSVPGVKYVRIFKPVDDVIRTNKKAESGSSGIGFNEIIALGNIDIKFYYEAGNFKIPPVG